MIHILKSHNIVSNSQNTLAHHIAINKGAEPNHSISYLLGMFWKGFGNKSFTSLYRRTSNIKPSKKRLNSGQQPTTIFPNGCHVTDGSSPLLSALKSDPVSHIQSINSN